MNGKELLDILLKYQYEGNLEKMDIYYDKEPDNEGIFEVIINWRKE